MRARSERIWGAWLVAILASFGYLEYVAYVQGKHLTLSRCLAYWLGVEPRRPWGRLGPLIFLAGWTFLTYHITRMRTEQP